MIAAALLVAALGVLTAIALGDLRARRRPRRRKRPPGVTAWGAVTDMRRDRCNHKPTHVPHVEHWARRGCGPGPWGAGQ